MNITIAYNPFMKFTFEVVDKIPAGFQIWDIPRDNLRGYLPICEMIPGTGTVVNKTLKLVPMPEEYAEDLCTAQRWHKIRNLADAKKAQMEVWYGSRYYDRIARILKEYSE